MDTHGGKPASSGGAPLPDTVPAAISKAVWRKICLPWAPPSVGRNLRSMSEYVPNLSYLSLGESTGTARVQPPPGTVPSQRGGRGAHCRVGQECDDWLY